MLRVRSLCFAAALLLAEHATANELDRVLLLHSIGPYFSPWSSISPQFRELLSKRSRKPVDIYEASLQGERIREAPEEVSLIGYINALFPQQDLKLIVAMGAPATRFVLRHRAALFPSAPLLIASSDVRTFSDLKLSNNETACATLYDPTVQIDTILRLLPDTKDILVATGAAPNGDFWTNLFQRLFERYASHVTFHWFTGLTSDEMLKRVETLPPRSAIFYVSVNSDARGAPLDGDAMLLRSLEIERTPVFTHVDSYFGRGIVGGPMFSSREIAEKCAEVAVRLLSGENAGDIKIPPIGLAAAVYDWRQLQRWHISESLLPPGSTVQFREPGLWEQYRLYIAAFVAALLVQAALIGWLVSEHWRRQAAEAQVINQMHEMARMNRVATMGEFSAALTHEIRQPLAAIASLSSAGLNWLNKKVPDLDEARASLESVIKQTNRADDVIKSVRAMFSSETKVKTEVNLSDLVRRVLTLTTSGIRQNNIVLETDLADDPPPLLNGDPVQLQQVILNLVNNAVEAMITSDHWARILSIVTRIGEEGTIFLTVADTGPGFDAKVSKDIFRAFVTTKPQGMGMGLSICRTIVEQHGGQLTLAAAKPRGAVLTIAFPGTKGG